MLETFPEINNKPMTEEQLAETKAYIEGLDISPAPKPKRKVQPYYTLTAADYRPFIHKHLLKGGMVAGELEMLAEKEFKDRFTAGDLAPVISKKGRQQFPAKWRHRLKCAAEAMRKSGLLYPHGAFKQRDPGWWQLTPKGLESKDGY